MLALAPFATSRFVRCNVPLGASALALSLFVASPVFAHGGGALGGPPLALPPPPPGDGQTALGILKDVEAKAVDVRSKKVVADASANARKALERAHGARSSGDTSHAKQLDGLALEWAETARDLLRAADAEQAATAVADKAREATLQVERARALLEETQARRGRAEAEQERALAEEQAAKAAAAKAEEERIASGKVKDKPKDKPKGSGKPAVKQGGTKADGKKGKR